VDARHKAGHDKPGSFIMSLPHTARETLLAEFLKASARRDLDAMYRTVTPDFVWSLPVGPDAPHARKLTTRDEIAAYFEERARIYASVKFHDLAWQHAPDASFMTFRVIAEYKDGRPPVDALGLERYTFRDGLIAIKDAYWKRIGTE
jgi:ketosteroid isomerase-like protein